MPDPNNQEIAQILTEIASILEIQAENPFRIRAYRKASLVIANLAKPLSIVYQEEGEKGLENLPGIGKNIAQKIVEILETGGLAQYQQLQQEIPPQLLHLVDIRGLGAIRLRTLHEKLGINNLDDLKKAANGGKIRQLPGFGEKSEENIIKGVTDYEKHVGRYLLVRALPYAQELVDYIRQMSGVAMVEMAGSVRRRRETVADLDILVAGKPDIPLYNHLKGYNKIKEIPAHGETKITLVMEMGIQSDVRLLAPESFGAGMLYFTGSKQHNIALRRRALERGWKLSEYGLFSGEKRIAGVTEEEIFRILDLPFIPPELREDQGEIEAAESGRLPRLIRQEDLKGDLHDHTNHSDGYHSLEQMAEAAKNMGYQYLAITDHSKSQTQARGLDENRLLQQIEQIDQLNANLKDFRVLKGMEVDILKDGSLDLPVEVLQKLDCVVGSIHSYFNQPKEETTARMIKAIRSGVVNIIGHPTARLLQEREPVELDMLEVMKAAKKQGVVMELNAHGNRLDLHDAHCHLAKELGVKISISTDSHNCLQLPVIQYGISTARRGWLEAGDVINTLPGDELLKFLRGQRKDRDTQF
ncbi:MAG: DNA polymerase/3'-5' exonuclease PolX [Candidatus Schekmanbacteria bacterium]|nr:DNA polymerase/3'-5' exonuclease PolX [Candidatus Schekmanbacteria bacterium]